MAGRIGRPPFGFLLFDCPSDHEIEGSLVTESETIKAVVSNRRLGTQLKVIRCISKEAFKKLPGRTYRGIRYVHLGGHGSPDGLGLIGGTLKWSEVASRICRMLPKLKDKEQRVLTLSCCFSSAGARKMQKKLKPYFSGVYYFIPDRISFAKTITIWSMFYLKKKLRRPHRAVVESINRYLGEEVIAFK